MINRENCLQMDHQLLVFFVFHVDPAATKRLQFVDVCLQWQIPTKSHFNGIIHLRVFSKRWDKPYWSIRILISSGGWACCWSWKQLLARVHAWITDSGSTQNASECTPRFCRQHPPVWLLQTQTREQRHDYNSACQIKSLLSTWCYTAQERLLLGPQRLD